MKICILHDCSDLDKIYGAIICANNDVTSDMIQSKIIDIKARFDIEGFDGWCIDDVVEKLPSDWDAWFVDSQHLVI